MCGIVGYVGQRSAMGILLEGLHRLEYRGYDSAGLAVPAGGELRCVKAVGKVRVLSQKAQDQQERLAASTSGIAHTRWATHGAPTEPNAHPHLDDTGRFAVVHNGIIENYAALRRRLEEQGHQFLSETDTEVLPHLLREFYQGDLAAALAAALRQVEGTYGIAALCREHPDQLVIARKGSPIVIGVGNGETLVASDAAAIVAHTNRVIYLDDNDLAVVNASDVQVRNLSNAPVSRPVTTIEWDLKAVEKGGHPHFMLKEIFEQPAALKNAIRGRLDHQNGSAFLAGLNLTPRGLVEIQRLIIAACGTSLHAGMVGEYFFEDLAGMVTEVEQAAEFRYRNPIVDPGTLVLAISQSGETADTLAALREGLTKGAHVAAICNVVGSTIAREAGRGVYLHAGPEIGVASTKAFTCQVSVLLMMALKFARARRLRRQDGALLAAEIERLPALAQGVLDRAPEIAAVAQRFAQAEHFFFIGRGPMYPVALEGALKLKEISYIHAEGYNAAELKHGPIALLEAGVPVVALANDADSRDKMVGNIQECKARQAPVIAVVSDGDEELERAGAAVIRIPPASRYVAPIPTAIALQLLAYYAAAARGCPIDQPRNLAKSVTVE